MQTPADDAQPGDVSLPDHGRSPAAQGGTPMALVANAQAGALLGQKGTTLEDALRKLGRPLHIIPHEVGTLPERIARACSTGAAMVVVAGGDGTIACAAAALAGTGMVLGVIPCGTMNLLARDLHIDPADLEAALHVLAAGRARDIDVGEVSSEEQESHVFLCASMLGTPARLSRHREAGRQHGNGVLGWAIFAWAALRALLQNRSMKLTLRCNGQERQCRTPSLTVTVNKLDDAAGRLFGRSVLHGGVLSVYLVRRSSVFAQALLLLRTAITGSLHAPEIEVIETTDLVVDCAGSALHVLVDGELRLMKPPVRYRIRPRALRVMAPVADTES
jgi:diacylglycerol kinase family enzyme